MSLSEKIQGRGLRLLPFALEREGVRPNQYFIGKETTYGIREDRICLIHQDDKKWRVFYGERGEEQQIAVHDHFYTAFDDFYCRLVTCKTPWDYRAEWDALMQSQG